MTAKQQPKRTPNTSPTTGTSAATSPARPAETEEPARADGLAGDSESGFDNVPATEPPVGEEAEPTPAEQLAAAQVPSDVRPLREPDKFKALQAFVAHDLTLPSLEGLLGRMVNAGILTEKRLWETVNPWQTAPRALAKLQDPEQLAGYWPMVCFLRGRMLGNPRADALLAGAWAILDVVRELRAEAP
ncbi:MAG: hypothetical protein V2A79_09840 [Planctomycetota bacterium]